MNELPKHQRDEAPNDEHPLVNRQSELALVEAKLAEAAQHNLVIARPVICFWGAHGIGKSWLLHELQRRYTRKDPVDLGADLTTVTVRIDFDPLKMPIFWDDGSLEKTRLLREVAMQVEKQTQERIEFDDRTTDVAWADAVVKMMTRLTAQARVTPIFLLDNLDVLAQRDSAAYDWLEQHLLEGLVVTVQILIVLASRSKPTYLQRWQLRRRTDIQRLDAFSVEDTAEQVQLKRECAQAIHGYSHGYPMATAFLRQDLHDAATAIDDAAAAPALQDAAKIILEDVEPRLRPIAQLICVSRRVEVDLMRAVLQACGDTQAKVSDRELDDELLALRDQCLLYWDSEKKTYAFDPALRRVLAEHLRLYDPQFYRLAGAAVADRYRSRLPDELAFLPWALPELLFSICLYADGDAERSAALHAELANLQALLQERQLLNSELTENTLEALNKDEELKELLPGDVWQRLTQVLQPS